MGIPGSVAEDQTPRPQCFAQLFRMALDGCDLRPQRDRLIEGLQANPADSADLMSLCIIEQLLLDQPAGLARQAEALGLHRLYRSSWPASPNALRVLAFKAAGDFSTNMPIEFLLKGFDVVLYSLYVIPGPGFSPGGMIPDIDVAIVTVGESDRDQPVMREIERLIRNWTCPVLNRPDRVLQLSRPRMYVLLRGIPGLLMPETLRIGRTAFDGLSDIVPTDGPFDQTPTFPLIARPNGSHAGRGLVKLDNAEAIREYLARQPEAEFFITPYVDYRSADGQFRKYRIVWIDGRPFPCHMAIADQWKVWYYNAGMAGSPDKRAEEEQFMAGFAEGFGRRHSVVLAAIAARLGLEYVGVDCAELPDGRLIVFEGDISLVVHDMDPPVLYPYKVQPMQQLFAAFYSMLKRRAG